MKKNKSINMNEWLDEKYGKKGTPKREEFRKKAYNYYYEQIKKREIKPQKK